MYKQTHHRLTFVFTAITSMIVIVMSVFYIYMSEQAQWTNGKASFSSDMNTLISNFEHQNEISYEWLSKIESNGNYIVACYDQEIPLSYNTRYHNDDQKAILNEIYDFCEEKEIFSAISSKSSSFSSAHYESDYTSEDYGYYYVSYASIAGHSGNIHVIVLSQNPQRLKQQFKEQRLIFLLIDTIVILILFGFCYIYTQKLLQPIEENQKKQTQFIASASHELRTPMAVILSSISAFKKSDPKEQEHFFSVIESESKQMSALIGDMLTLASADNHSWNVAFSKVELDTLVLNCYESFTGIAKQKHVKFEINLPEDAIPECDCDEKRIRQVITILLHNAFSYCSSDGIVSLSLALTPQSFVLKVSDNGKGIPDEDKPHVFERFFRSTALDSSQEHFGLGLCIAKEIIDIHQGTITVEDTIPKELHSTTTACGTTFIIKLKR